jgi:hypothetical protein
MVNILSAQDKVASFVSTFQLTVGMRIHQRILSRYRIAWYKSIVLRLFTVGEMVTEDKNIGLVSAEFLGLRTRQHTGSRF